MTTSAAIILAEAADHLYSTCELYEDDDLDPADHLAVIQRAFTTSDCQDFAWMVHQITEWPCVTASWSIPGSGRGHHSLVRDPDGRLFDVCGYTDEADLARRFLGAKRAAAGKTITLKEADPEPLNEFDDVDDQGIESNMARIASIIRVLPYAPFNSEAFQKLAARALPGVDVPLIDENKRVLGR
jgi:hypothetical protein